MKARALIRALVSMATALLVATDAAEAQPAAPAGSRLPTLDSAVYIDSYVDSSDVYVGEPLTLTLEFWELTYRGVKVQPYYRTGGVELPETEGFYAGRLETIQHDATRNGALYSVTTYRQQLYPTTTGERTIGAWHWKGTVRGHTAGGASTLSVELATDPIEVNVRPLPEPPSTFRGAVGEFDLALQIEPKEMRQGVPARVELELSGRGNPQTLESPIMPEANWFQLNETDEEVVAAPGSDSTAFTKRFRFDFIPLEEGSHVFPPVSLTYFSPAEEQYKSIRTAAVDIEVAPSGEAETLVVIGGGAGPDTGLVLMDNGRLPLAPEIGAFTFLRSPPNLLPVLLVLAPLLFAVAFLARYGLHGGGIWRHWQRATPAIDRRLQAAADAPQPVDALNAVTRDILSEQMGRSVAGMTLPELQDFLAERTSPAASASVIAVLQTCQDRRYGKQNGETDDIAGLLERARYALHAIGESPRDRSSTP